MTPFQNEPLTQQQRAALLFEQNSARQLLAHGVHTLQDTLYFSPVEDAVLTTMSIGVEKLLKLSLGLRALGKTGEWPTKEQMRDDWGHRIDEMDTELRGYLRSWVADEDKNYVGTLLAAVDDDPIWTLIARCLDSYGRSGRFYYLDTLGSRPQAWDAPSGMWAEAERACIEYNDDLRIRQLTAIGGPPDLFDQFLRDVHGRLADSVVGWWHTIVRAGQHGAFGETGRSFASGIAPGDALPRVTSPRLI